MKTRQGFVSNSSSSSFICMKDGMTVERATEIMDTLVDMYKVINDRSEYPFTSDDYKISIADDEWLEEMEGWFECYRDGYNYYLGEGLKDPQKFKGKIIIDSTCDNTIPYVLFDLMEQTFETKRLHLG